ncbi:MAG: hypothetical protein RL199_989 [Pseudomonadota bacterium]
MKRLGATLVSLAASAEAEESWGPAFTEDAETTAVAVGVGANATTSGTGWQGTLALMGENRERALLTQLGVAVESVGTRRAGDAGPTGRLTQLTLHPFSVYAGYGALRLGAGWDVSWGLASVGPGATRSEGFGVAGRLGGGLSFPLGPLDVRALAHYRWMSGERVDGWFFDLFVGPR